MNIDMSRRELGDYFQSSHGWDILAARSVWAFGPERAGPNVLLDDTLPADVDKKLLNAVRESIVQVRWERCQDFLFRRLIPTIDVAAHDAENMRVLL